MPVILIVVGLGVGTSSVGWGAPQDTTALIGEVRRQLDREADLDEEDVAVQVAGTEATLTGRVETFWVKTKAIEAALAVDGIDTVASELTVREVESDDEIAAEVSRALATYRYNTIWDYIEGGVEDGVVTLSGSVTPDRDKPAELFERVARVDGVQDIQLSITTQSSSRRDRDLREIIAARVRRHPALAQYAIQVDPPFRILVDEAVVTLVGWVRGDNEKQLIEQIARQQFEVRDVVNLLQTG